MKKFLLLLILLSLPAFATIPIEVLEVYDDDTIKVKVNNGNEFLIRLQGIDCYETSKINRAYKRAYLNKFDIDEVVKKGNNTKTYINNLHKNSNTTSLDFMGIDGRVLGIVYFDDLNINKELLKNNVCMPYEFNKK
ncbi:MAG: thermonuclease family protein [Candidatus Gastranaerophilaceae bacterium]